MRTFILYLPVFLFLATTVTALPAPAATPVDPNAFTDPKDDVHNPLRYIPSNTLTSIALTLYLITTLALFFNIWRKGGKYMLTIAIGGAAYCAGLAIRYDLHNNPDSQGASIAESTVIILSPCAFIAGVYMLLGRLVRELRTERYLLINPFKLTKIFLTSDILTFLTQGAGGGLSTSVNTSSRNFGRKLFLAGLILQLISFATFVLLGAVWAYRVRMHERPTWFRDQRTGQTWLRDWRTLLTALGLSSAGILVRSFYRVIENSEGFEGHLSTTEKYFYLLDSLPLLIAVGVYVPIWPARYISNNLPRQGDAQNQSYALTPGQASNGAAAEEASSELQPTLLQTAGYSRYEGSK